MSHIVHDFYKELIKLINVLLTNFNNNDTMTTIDISFVLVLFENNYHFSYTLFYIIEIFSF